jgi:hypothetical protein
MKSKLGAVLQITLGFAVLGGIGWLLFVYVRRAFLYVVGLESETAAAIVTASATIAIALLSLIITKFLEARTAVRQENRAKKIPVYEQIISFIFQIFYQDRIPEKKLSEAEMVKVFSDLTEKIIVWGSDDVLKAYTTFRDSSIRATEGQQKSATEALFQLEQLLIAIRKDLGHGSQILKRGDILSLFVNDIRRHT